MAQLFESSPLSFLSGWELTFVGICRNPNFRRSYSDKICIAGMQIHDDQGLIVINTLFFLVQRNQ